jgi:hypothetical protein
VKLSIGGLKFVRRTKVTPPTRRMLATLDPMILDSELGRKILNFKPPTKSASYDASSKGLLTLWDLIFQDWRNIPVEACEIVSTVPSRPPEKFWEYFNKVLGKMTAQQKAAFISK